MREDASGRRQRAVMATNAEWERIGRAAAASGMDLSRFVIHRALDREPLPPERPGRTPATRWTNGSTGRACLDRLTDPGAANRWNAVGPAGEDGP